MRDRSGKRIRESTFTEDWQEAQRRLRERLKTVWQATLRRTKVPYFRIYDLRFTYTTRLSAGGVADEWVLARDAQVFKKYSQMKLQMKREALQKLNRKANEDRPGFVTEQVN